MGGEGKRDGMGGEGKRDGKVNTNLCCTVKLLDMGHITILELDICLCEDMELRRLVQT